MHVLFKPPGDRHDVMMTECYDIDSDEWTILSSATQGQSEAPAVKCDGKVGCCIVHRLECFGQFLFLWEI